MHRARLLVLKAHPDLAHLPRERILITSFFLGLYDRQLAASLAVVKIQTAADAERLAAEGEAVRRDLRSRRSKNNSLPEGEGEYLDEYPVRFSGRRLQPFAAQSPIECLLCQGNHSVQNCPALSAAQQCSARFVSKGDPDPSELIAFRVSAPNVSNESNAAFKRDGTAMLSDAEQSPVRVLDTALPAVNEESNPTTPRLQLFFVL